MAVAAGLKRAGHHVRFATGSLFADETRAAGLEFYPVYGDSERFFAGRGGSALREMVARPRAFQRFWNSYMAPFARQHLRETWKACEGFDAAICVPWFQAAPSLSEKLQRPCFAATVMPAIGIPTSAIANPYEKVEPSNSPQDNRRTWRSSTLIVAAPFEQVNEWRTDVLGLRPQTRLEAIRAYRRSHFLLGYSDYVLPTPADWPQSVNVSGFWFPQTRDIQPPEELVRFLEAHPKPLMVGFSSQVARDAETFTRRITDAVIASGKSAILLAGWGGLLQADLPSHILAQKSIPYDWIVPRLSGFLHHGGSGTTGMCLRYGIPQMIIPFGFDQPLWASRVAELGLGPQPMNPENIDVRALTEALVRVTEDNDIRQKAREVAVHIPGQDSVASAVRTVETTLGVRSACGAC